MQAKAVAGGVGDDVGAETLEETRENELIANSASKRNWRGIAIALIVIVIICALVVLVVIIVTPHHTEVKVKPALTVEDIGDERIKGTLRKSGQILTIEGGVRCYVYYNDSYSQIQLIAIETGQVIKVMKEWNQDEATDSIFSASADGLFLLFSSSHDIHDRFALKKYTVRDVNSGDEYYLNNASSNNMVLQKRVLLRYATWSPTGHNLVFVDANYNIFFKSDPSVANAFYITVDGSPDIFNGVPDWLYSRERFAAVGAPIYWAPDSSYFAYVKFNNSQVRKYRLTRYDSRHPYNLYHFVHFSKAANNDSFPVSAQISIHFVNVSALLSSNATNGPVIEPVGSSRDGYFYGITWTKRYLTVSWLNRLQNVIIINTYRWPAARAHGQPFLTIAEPIHVLEYPDDGLGWLEPLMDNAVPYMLPVFDQVGSSYFVILPKVDASPPASVSRVHYHIAEVDTSQQNVKPSFNITRGSCDVAKIVGVHQARKYQWIYFIANQEANGATDSTIRILYRRSLTNRQAKEPSLTECLTCGRADCSFVDAELSGNILVIHCLGPALPATYLLNLTSTAVGVKSSTPDSLSPKIWRKVTDNSQFKELFNSRDLPVIEDYKFSVDEQKYHSRVYLPPGLNKQFVTTYPLVIYVKSTSPSSFNVDRRFGLLNFASFLSSNRMIVVELTSNDIIINNREKVRHMSLTRQYYLDILKYFSNLSYVNENQTAIIGEGFGGYLALQALLSYKQSFQCAVITSAPTDWGLMDKTFAERYLGSYEENCANYTRSSVLDGLAGTNEDRENEESFINSPSFRSMKATKTLLIYATADRAVHFQHAILLTKRLTRAGVRFELNPYVNDLNVKAKLKNYHTTVFKYLNRCMNVTSNVRTVHSEF